MDWQIWTQNTLENLVFPIIIAVLGTQIWSLFLENKRKKDEQYEKLYGPLRLYFTFIDSIDNHIVSVSRAGDKALNQRSLNQYSGETLSDEFKIKNNLVDRWWMYIDKIKLLFETYPGFIKKDHFKQVEQFIDGYIAREYLGKSKSKNIDISLLNNLGQENKKLLNAIKKLKETILNEI